MKKSDVVDLTGWSSNKIQRLSEGNVIKTDGHKWLSGGYEPLLVKKAMQAELEGLEKRRAILLNGLSKIDSFIPNEKKEADQ